ncbi:EpsG family protein [Bacillus sp. T3]|uniref:EpsG family protein n=1 Tax=Bacillus sp. T3 TaxID=467262 RepID=UPI0029822D6D|nr:EpsG family protein [Bacillus sp. T3]
MTILWINLAIVFIFSFLARFLAAPNNNMENIPIRPNILFLFGAMISLVLVSGLRNNIGDTYFYMHIYEMNEFTWEYIHSQKDFGFGIFQKILKNYSDDPQILLVTTAFLTNVLIILVLRKYSRIFELSTYVYITGGLFLVTMNGIRQCLAAAIIFTGTKFLINGNWFLYTLIVLLASTFHQSALVLIPIYFLVRFKAWSKTTIVLLLFSVLIVIGFDKFSSVLFSSIENTQYGHYANFSEGGASSIRVLVTAVPLLIAFLGREKLSTIFPKSDYIVNMSIIGLVFMIISTQNWIFARFSIYFSLYQLILISWCVKLFREKEQKLVYYGILFCYFIFYYYESVMSLNIVYKSNYL